MKIAICGSMSASKQMLEMGQYLTEKGNEVFLPANTEKYASGSLGMEIDKESAMNKIHGDLIRGYFNKINDADVVIIANYDKNGIKNYVGGNSFLEASFAHVLNKKLYFVNDIPDISYKDELIAMQPIILNGDLSKIFYNKEVFNIDKNDTKLFVAAKAIIKKDDKVLLLKESGSYGDGVNEGLLDFPGGRIKPDESVETALIREVFEETGLKVKPGKIIAIDEWWPKVNDKQWHVVGVFFECELESDEITLSRDHNEYVWLSPADYPKYNVIKNLENVFKKLIN